MSDQHLQMKPHRLPHDPTSWWYEEPAGLCVVQEYRGTTGAVYGTRSVVIPWRAIRAALKRKDRP